MVMAPAEVPLAIRPSAIQIRPNKEMNSKPATTTCARHPNVQTALRCASCGAYICPMCLVATPVGAKCKRCASQRGNRVFTLTPMQTAGAILAGALAGAVAGWGVEFFGFFTLFIAFAYGAFAGEMVLRASGRTRGTRMEVITGVTMAAGAIGGRLILAAVVLHGPNQGAPPLGIFTALWDLITNPIRIIAIAIAITAAISRIRYI